MAILFNKQAASMDNSGGGSHGQLPFTSGGPNGTRGQFLGPGELVKDHTVSVPLNLLAVLAEQYRLTNSYDRVDSSRDTFQGY